MSTFFSTKLAKKLIFAGVSVLSLVLLAAPALPVSAITSQSGIGISPSQVDPNEKFSKGWFIEKMEPGSKVERKATISNYSNEEKKVLVQAEDYLVAGEGSFSYSDKQETTKVGSWVTLEKSEVTIPAQRAVVVPFTVTIPKDVKPGEYAGVLVVQEAPKDGQTSGFNVVSRIGARIYITVPGDLTSGFEFKNFKFITSAPSYTDPTFYQNYIRANLNAPQDQIFLTMAFQNTGNVFSKMKGTIEVEGPNNSKASVNFNRDFGSFDPVIDIKYLPVPEGRWQVGKYKAKFTFENSALISSNKSDVKNVSPTQVVETEFDMTQAMLDQMRADFAKAKEGKPVSQTPAVNDSKNDDGLEVKDATKEEESKKDEKNNESNQNGLLIAGGVIILALIAVIAVLLLKDRKKAKTEESAKTDASKPKEVKKDKSSK